MLGFRLREPLTLGHALLLDELGSPLLHGGTILPGDIALAVFVLSQPHRVARKDVSAWWAPLLMRWWGRRSASRDFDEEANALVEWFVDSVKPPAFWRKNGTSRECSSPWWINRIATAMGELGFSFESATDMPAKRLGQLVMAYAEWRGEVELVTQSQEEFHAHCRRLDDERERSQRN